jgi:hypothetical protein
VINHARCLLLNAPRLAATTPGEEYVPADFRPVPVPAVVRKIRTILFGTSPDRYILNFRLAQLMPILHETELEEFVLAYDSRITYWPPYRTELYSAAFTPTIAPADDLLTLLGTLMPDEATGRLQHQWQISPLGETVRVRRLTSPVQEVTYTPTFTAGRSESLALPGSTLRFNYASSGSGWYVTAVARPRRTAADLLRLLVAGLNEQDDVALFDKPYQGDKKTWQALWRTHPDGVYRLGALLLGVVAKLHENLGKTP